MTWTTPLVMPTPRICRIMETPTRSLEATSHGGPQRRPVLKDVNTRQSGVKFVKGDRFGPTTHKLIRVTTDAFNIEEDSTAALLVAGRSYSVKKTALFEHCGFVRNAVLEANDCPILKLEDRDPVIVRAFIQAISGASSGLPDYNIEFVDTTSFYKLNRSDPLGIISKENITTRKIIWNIDAGQMMYDLALAMDYPIVKNMVTDRMYHMFVREFEQKRTQPLGTFYELDLPLEFVSSLIMARDEKFIQMVCRFYACRMLSQGSVKWPESFTDDMVDHVEDFGCRCRE
jgi:hypothetical protein